MIERKMSLYIFFKIKVVKILGTAALLLMGTVYADCEICSSEQCNISRLQIGESYTRANIKIDGQSSFDGNLGGVLGSYEYRPWNSFYGGLKAAWRLGETENSDAHRQLTYVDVQERVGYTYAPCSNDWSLTVFSGFGYRYLGHRLKQSGESIKFDYNEFYVPVGCISEYFFCCNWSLGLNFTWMPQVYPTVEISPLQGAYWKLENTLGNVLVEVPLTYFFTQDRRYALVFNPFYERWEDGQSTAKASSGEELGLPKNSYNLWGVEVNVVFSF